MEIYTKENGFLDRQMEKDAFITLTGKFMSDIGKTIIMKEKEENNGLIILIMMGISLMDKDMEKEFLYGLMEVFIMESLKIIR